MSNALVLSPARANLARAISDVCSPPVVAIPALMLGIWSSQGAGALWFGMLYFAIAVLVPVLYVVWALRTGRISDFHLADRRERVGPFVVSIVSGLVAVGLLFYLGAPRDLVAPILALLAQTLLLFLITLSWQVSVHTATIAGVITFACLAIGPLAVAFSWLVPLVGWSRVYLGRHTVAQTIAGAGLGVACFVVLFALRGVVW